MTDTVTTSTLDDGPQTPGGAPPRTLEDLHEILKMYNEVTQRLQVSHERLQQEVVRLTEQLEQKNRELELKKRLAALGEMAAGIAHEIRNPLGGIGLYASTLAAEVADRPLAAELVRKISSGVKGLNALVSDMLTFTRDLHLDAQPQELESIVLEALELAAPSLLAQDITARVHGSVKGKTVRADRRLLSRVLLNLVLNGAEAITEANITGGRIEIRACRNGDKNEITVEDNGPGIPQDLVEKIFDPFFTTKHTGTGLGLAIVHRIIEAHGGQITAHNRKSPDRGARIRIVLPHVNT
ncbi:MAG TPA: ATP-binding protein [Phycisphaerae bacterium]|nr:ATP-binding protein [Phycisphaerae bacterium]